MSDKKRKASSSLESRPKKKQQTPSTTTFEHVKGSEVLRPILASTPGVSFPHDIKFQCFSRKTPGGSQTLLHSSDHPTIDYTAVEGTELNEAHLKHYVAVYDPTTKKLQVIEAKRLTIRGSIRPHQQIDEPEDEDTADFLAAQGTRAALTEAFGSKKSKKAVQAIFENRQLGQGVEGATIAEAITANIGDQADEDEEFAAASAVARANKPLPNPNLTTDQIDEVYSISKLVSPSPSSQTLKQMPIQPWLARIGAGKDVTSLRTRFVANRISYIGKHLSANPSGAQYTLQMQLLRYIEMMIQICHFVSKYHRNKIPFIEKWPEGTLMSNTPLDLVKKIVNHHFPDNRADDRTLTLLKTTILALALHILPPSGTTGGQQLIVETHDIQLDLTMEATDVQKLYRELGCVVKPATDKELMSWKYANLIDKKKKRSKDDDIGGGTGRKTGGPTFARLKFPLEFPKVSSGRRTAARR